MKLPSVRDHIVVRIDKDTLERKRWERILETIPQICKITDSPEFVRGLRTGLYFGFNLDSLWASGNGSVFAEETRKRLGLNQHQYNLCCEAIINHKYNKKYNDLWLQKKTRDEIIDDLSNGLSRCVVCYILDYYDKYR